MDFNKKVAERARLFASQGMKRKHIHMQCLDLKDCPRSYSHFQKKYGEHMNQGESDLSDSLTKQAMSRATDPENPSDRILELGLKSFTDWGKSQEDTQEKGDSDKKTDIISKLVEKLGTNEPKNPEKPSEGESSGGS